MTDVSQHPLVQAVLRKRAEAEARGTGQKERDNSGTNRRVIPFPKRPRPTHPKAAATVGVRSPDEDDSPDGTAVPDHHHLAAGHDADSFDDFFDGGAA